MIIRGIHFSGKTRYDEFLSSPEKISTNILADRPKKLKKTGLIMKTQDSLHSQTMSYQLTESGVCWLKFCGNS